MGSVLEAFTKCRREKWKRLSCGVAKSHKREHRRGSALYLGKASWRTKMGARSGRKSGWPMRVKSLWVQNTELDSAI